MIQALPDPDARARREIRDLIDETFLVEAGAGTGKTSALVERVVALVLGGRKIERIVAITFTEKAAAELRDRVRSGLEAAEHEESKGESEKNRVREALASLDRAHISTIHAFCQSLLRQFAPELAVDPAFEVQDEVLAERRFEEQWRLYLDRLGSDDEAVAAVNRALDLGLSTKDIGNLAASLWQQGELAPLLSARPLSAPLGRWPDLTAILASLEALPLAGVPPDDKLKPRIEALMGSIETMIAAGDEREAYLASAVGSLPTGWTLGRQENWPGPSGIAAAREAAQTAGDELRRALQELRSHALAAILGYVVDFVMRDSRARGREGKLVFDDLILRVRELLRDRPTARSLIRGRFDCLLIDEFQDTDPLQVEIAWAFASNEVGELEPGRLFLVGDPKQSIYRFRRADMAVYSNTRSRVSAAGGRLPELKLNRRSRRPLVDWVNRVFATVIGPGDAPEVQPPYREILPARGADLAGPGVAWFGGALDLAARDVRRREASAIAGQIRAVVDNAWAVEDRALDTVRGAAFRDIAVLVPTRAILAPLERSLQDAGIPYRVEGGSLVYFTQEVRDVINCLTAIDDPADEVAIAGALRSPAYACSDIDLAAFRFEGGRFDYTRAGLDDREGRVADGLRSLRAYHQSRHQGSIASLVERFLSERSLVEVGIVDQANRNSFRRARFMVEQARAFEAGGPESLRAFVAWLERRAGRAVLDNEGAGLDDDEDAVRVLTAHGAKGLEFPIVLLAGLGIGPASDRRVFGIDRGTGEIAVAVGASTRNAEFTLGPVAQINAQEARHLKAERDRLLYVAATRARDHLLVSLFHRAAARDSAAARLIDAGAKDGAVEHVAADATGADVTNSLGGLVVDDPGALETFDAQRAALVARARKMKFISATGLAALVKPERWKPERSDDSEPWARGRGGTHVGRAVHAALQSLSWEATDAEIGAVARAQAVAEAVPDRAAEVADLIRAALASQAAARARAAPRALREVPFAMPLDGILVEGFADAIIAGGEGLEIIDWKTDDVSAAEARERLTEYELQAGLYVLGIEAATGRRVTRLTYVFVRAGLELSPGNPAELASRARAQVLDL